MAADMLHQAISTSSKKSQAAAASSDVGGSGGGRSDMAQAGGTKIENLSEAMDKARKIVRNQ